MEYVPANMAFRGFVGLPPVLWAAAAVTRDGLWL